MNSSTLLYPAASAARFALSYRPDSILTLTTGSSSVTGPHPHRVKTFFPTIWGGVGNPNSAKIDGAMSTSEGDFPLIGRLLNSTPGTSSASAQWSALQAESLSSVISSVNSPAIVAHEAR